MCTHLTDTYILYGTFNKMAFCFKAHFKGPYYHCFNILFHGRRCVEDTSLPKACEQYLSKCSGAPHTHRSIPPREDDLEASKLGDASSPAETCKRLRGACCNCQHSTHRHSFLLRLILSTVGDRWFPRNNGKMEKFTPYGLSHRYGHADRTEEL
jgi:hypothetical protein